MRRYRETLFSQPRVGVAGFFTVELIHARTGIVKRRLRFKNLITNNGMDQLGVADFNSRLQWLAVGTGNTAPAFADNGLVAEVDRSNSNGGFVDGDNTWIGAPDYYWSRTRTRVFLEAEGNGNLAELGFFNVDAPGGILFNRQLFKDDLGAPTVITKTIEDQLRVTYEFRIYPSRVASVQEIDFAGVLTDVTHQMVDIDSTAGAGTLIDALGTFETTRCQVVPSDVMPAPEASPDLSGASGASAVALQAYGAGNFYRDLMCEWNAAAGNIVGGIGGMGRSERSSSGATTYPTFFSTFAPKIAKTNLQKLVIYHRIGWVRV